MGELARQPGCPEVAESVVELFTPRPGDGFSFFEKYIWPVGVAIGGAGSPIVSNIILHRPIWSGIQRHILLGVGGWYLGIYVRNEMFASRAEADASLKHYASLHPDEFPPFERKRIADMYVPFKPTR